MISATIFNGRILAMALLVISEEEGDDSRRREHFSIAVMMAAVKAM
jgi:DNA invertase Pin-like site-specific DNA recombinase